MMQTMGDRCIVLSVSSAQACLQICSADSGTPGAPTLSSESMLSVLPLPLSFGPVAGLPQGECSPGSGRGFNAGLWNCSLAWAAFAAFTFCAGVKYVPAALAAATF